MHKHKTKSSLERPYCGPIESSRPNPKAHGWVTAHQTCSCGATRRVNRNGQQFEKGAWEL